MLELYSGPIRSVLFAIFEIKYSLANGAPVLGFAAKRG